MAFNDGGHAFPNNSTELRYDNSAVCQSSGGMSLWDFYAAAALSTMALVTNDPVCTQRVAIVCADYADAMIAEREKRRATS